MRQFIRRVRLIVGDTQGIQIDDLRMVFTVTRSIISFPNQLELRIYNLSRTTQVLIEEKFTKVFLFAGYGDNLQLIFKGDIQNVSLSSNGVDGITTIFSGDGHLDFLTTTFSKTFSPTVPLKTIITELAKSFKNTSIGTLNGLANKASPLRSTTLDGHTASQLDKLAKTFEFEWKIENGVFTTSASKNTLSKSAVVVSAETGLLEVPVVTEIGVNIKTLLNPLYVPRGLVKIETTDSQIRTPNAAFYKLPRTKSKGVFPIVKVTHVGDTHGAQWTSSVETQFNL